MYKYKLEVCLTEKVKDNSKLKGNLLLNPVKLGTTLEHTTWCLHEVFQQLETLEVDIAKKSFEENMNLTITTTKIFNLKDDNNWDILLSKMKSMYDTEKLKLSTIMFIDAGMFNGVIHFEAKNLTIETNPPKESEKSSINRHSV